jgi:hypothetical protein
VLREEGIVISAPATRPPGGTTRRIKDAAQARQTSVDNKSITEISVQTPAIFYDAETRFRAITNEANVDAALTVLDRKN